jgi:sigma-E factor negative regulatory protein RseB
MRALKGVFVSLLLAAVDALAAATTTAPQLPQAKQALTAMLKSMKNLNYQGTVVFLRNGKLEPMHYIHAAEGGREQERLLSLNAPLREIVRDTNNVSCLFKSTHQLIADNRPYEHSFLVDIPNNPGDLDAHYTLTVVGEETIALQPTYIIAIQPKDPFRYGRKIWLEKQHFLPLKAVVYNPANEMLEQLVFTELTLENALPFADTQSTKTSPALVDVSVSTQAAFVINELPPGFRELFFTRRPLHNSAQPVDHLLLSDGLALVSVYMEHKSPNSLNAPKTVQSLGAINFSSRIIGEFEFTVLGEVPTETVRLIAENIKLRARE